jgi:hypothetical protein
MQQKKNHVELAGMTVDDSGATKASICPSGAYANAAGDAQI